MKFLLLKFVSCLNIRHFIFTGILTFLPLFASANCIESLFTPPTSSQANNPYVVSPKTFGQLIKKKANKGVLEFIQVFAHLSQDLSLQINQRLDLLESNSPKELEENGGIFLNELKYLLDAISNNDTEGFYLRAHYFNDLFYYIALYLKSIDMLHPHSNFDTRIRQYYSLVINSSLIEFLKYQTFDELLTNLNILVYPILDLSISALENNDNFLEQILDELLGESIPLDKEKILSAFFLLKNHPKFSTSGPNSLVNFYHNDFLMRMVSKHLNREQRFNLATRLALNMDYHACKSILLEIRFYELWGLPKQFYKELFIFFSTKDEYYEEMFGMKKEDFLNLSIQKIQDILEVRKNNRRHQLGLIEIDPNLVYNSTGRFDRRSYIQFKAAVNELFHFAENDRLFNIHFDKVVSDQIRKTAIRN